MWAQAWEDAGGIMAIFTINTNSNYSSIKSSLANGDTIRIGATSVRLTIDEQPLLINILVNSPGTNGRVTVSGAWDLSTWSMVAGTAPLIDGTFPAGAILGSANPGSTTGANCVTTNAGTITNAIGGSVFNAWPVQTNTGLVVNATGGSLNGAHGVNVNNGTVTNATGGSANTAAGVLTNNGTVTNAFAGSFAGAHGVNANNGLVVTATGGAVAAPAAVNTNGPTGVITNCLGSNSSASSGCITNNGLITNCNGGSLGVGCATNASRIINCTGGSGANTHGCSTNEGHVENATGGSGSNANGVNTSRGSIGTATGGSNATARGVTFAGGQVLRAFNSTGQAIQTCSGDQRVVIGPDFRTTITRGAGTLETLTTLYTIGPLHPSAVIPAGVTVIQLSEGSGFIWLPRNMAGGFTE